MIKALSHIATLVLPLWNVPLIVRIQRRKSSQDISFWWALGVWTCLTLMLPSGWSSPDAVFKVFVMMNFALFSAVMVQVLRYR